MSKLVVDPQDSRYALVDGVRVRRIMGGLDPYASSVFASSYASVEQFNPQRYYAETGMTSQSLPTGTTGPQGTAAAPAPTRVWVIIGVIAVVIWALERHKLKLKGILR